MIRCWAEGYCLKKSPENCNDSCDIHVLLRALYSQSAIPKRYQYSIELRPSQADVPKFIQLRDFMENILKNVELGKGLFIYGNGTGNGKTSWACKIMSYYFRKVVFNSLLEYEGYFINTPTFLEELRASYSNKTLEFEDKMDKVMNCRLLIIDDLGSEKPSEWVTERLYTIINERVSNGLATIYTSNVNLDKLEGTLGSRIVSRIKGSTDIIELTGSDRRA